MIVSVLSFRRVVSSFFCQAGIWKKQVSTIGYRVVTSPFGNILGDAGFAWCDPDELVMGGGGTCSAATVSGYPGGAGTAISSMPVKKGQPFPHPGFGGATENGWYYDCNGYPGVGGIGQAVAACFKP